MLLLLEPTHLVHPVDDFGGIVSEEIILLRLIDYFYGGYVGLIAVVPGEVNVVLHEEVHKAVLFLGRQVGKHEHFDVLWVLGGRQKRTLIISSHLLTPTVHIVLYSI